MTTCDPVRLDSLTNISTIATSDILYIEDASEAVADQGKYITIAQFDTRYQAASTGLTEIAALTPTDGVIIVGNGSAWVAESGATARTSLGLAIGTDVQAQSTYLQDIANLSPGAGTDGYAVAWDNGGGAFTLQETGSALTVDTIANILATASPASGDMFYASDVERFLVYDGAAFRVASIPFGERSTDDNIGVGWPIIEDDDPRGYYIAGITEKTLWNCIVGGSDQTTEGGLRQSSSEIQFYLDSEWKTAVTGFRFREDPDGTGHLEFQPDGSEFWIDVTTGNSYQSDLNGNPVIWNWKSDIGALQSPPVIGGRTLS